MKRSKRTVRAAPDNLLPVADLLAQAGFFEAVTDLTLRSGENGWWFFSMSFKPSEKGEKEIDRILGRAGERIGKPISRKKALDVCDKIARRAERKRRAS